MKLFIGGDFNLGDIEWSLGRCVAGARDKNHCEKLINISNNHLLEQVNTLPTLQGRILDLLFTSHSSLILRHTICPPIGLSDHDILSVTTHIKPVINKKAPRTVYNYKIARWDQIRDDMTSFKDTYFQSDPYAESVEHNWTNFKDTLLKSLNTNIPTKILKGNKKDLPWMSKKIKNMIHKKRNFITRPEALKMKKIS